MATDMSLKQSLCVVSQFGCLSEQDGRSAGAAYPAAWDAGLHIRRSCLYWYAAVPAVVVSAYSRLGYWNIP